MKYSIDDRNGSSISLELGTTVVVMDTDYYEFELTFDQFRDLRKAIGYVWQEIESKDAK